VQEHLAFAGVVRQRAMLADGSLQARDLTAMYLDRITHLDPALNAFVSVRGDAARWPTSIVRPERTRLENLNLP
jgi:Asp-tRNA(Asn)/Glu-tRNA(Gln) amidotransferase A subunit family amidase